jgi:tetratricopeptide (TPR) repeat protein
MKTNFKDNIQKIGDIDNSNKSRNKTNSNQCNNEKADKERKKIQQQNVVTKSKSLFNKRNKIELLEKANQYYINLNFDDALELVNEVLRADPFFYSAYKLRADIFWRLGDIFGYPNYYRSAIKDLKKVISNKSYNTNNYIVLGLCYLGLGDNESIKKALKLYKKALELSPWSSVIILDIMEAQICLERYEQAYTTYKKHVSSMNYVIDKLVGESLVCVALALDGKPYQNFLQLLYNFDIEIKESPGWSTRPIDRHLIDIKRTRDNVERIEQAEYLQDLFKEHFKFLINR